MLACNSDISGNLKTTHDFSDGEILLPLAALIPQWQYDNGHQISCALAAHWGTTPRPYDVEDTGPACNIVWHWTLHLAVSLITAVQHVICLQSALQV